MITYPYAVRALRVVQPLGAYYVAVLPARLLLDVSFSHTMAAHLDPNGSYTVEGTQRLPQPKRLDQIVDYIDRSDAAFPNSIILAANFDSETGLTDDPEPPSDDDPEAAARAAEQWKQIWTVEEGEDGCWTLTIPTATKLAAVIDGQHRLFSFPKAAPPRLDMDLICAVFLDLPKPLQAQLFATINSTQKPVDKSLTYELFGYNISEETAEYWTPDKLAVFLTRRLNTDRASPLYGNIVVAPKRDDALLRLNEAAEWRVSTAVIVEGIMRLFSSNARRDSNEMLTPPVNKTRAALAHAFRDRSPLRDVYLAGNDAVLYTLVLNYLKACSKVFWENRKPGSFIIKTIGIQAQLDVLRRMCREAYDAKDLSEAYFVRRLEAAGTIDFAAPQFQNASGSGRGLIRRAIETAIGLSK